MKYLFLVTFYFLASHVCAKHPDEKRLVINLNQIGYYPTAPKCAMIKNPTGKQFSLVNNQTGKTVYRGCLSVPTLWELSGERLSQADFSSYCTPGEYHMRVGHTQSQSFTIKKEVWSEVSCALMKSFYFQRCSFPLEKSYAGVWERPAGHPDTTCLLHTSIHSKEQKKASPGGWYDAGDYGKYVVNAGVTVGTLLAMAEKYPGIFPDGSLNIPESKNGKSDLLDEVKFELDWLLTMQDTDGGVFFKVTTKSFCGFVMPHEDTMERYIIGKTTASTLNFAAVMAMAGRIYRNYDVAFASKCLQGARHAWQWAQDTLSITFKNPKDISTGEYGDSQLADEYVWAATELFITTGYKEYQTYLDTHTNELGFVEKDIVPMPSWASVGTLATISLAFHPKAGELSKSCRVSIISGAEQILKQIKNHPARIPSIHYFWGSNSEMANHGLYLVYAYTLTQDKKFLGGAMEVADYFLGKNATGYSFITGFGTKRVMHPHHRPSGADKVTEPVPGLVAGGPNGELNDKETGINYLFTEPPLAYTDVLESYASNEVAINWNAPTVALFAIIEQIQQFIDEIELNTP